MSEILQDLDKAQAHLEAFLGGFDVADSLYIAERLGKYLEAYQKDVKSKLASAFEPKTPINTSSGIQYQFSRGERRAVDSSAHVHLIQYAEHLLPELKITISALESLVKKEVLSQEEMDGFITYEETLRFTSKAVKETK